MLRLLCGINHNIQVKSQIRSRSPCIVGNNGQLNRVRSVSVRMTRLSRSPHLESLMDLYTSRLLHTCRPRKPEPNLTTNPRFTAKTNRPTTQINEESRSDTQLLFVAAPLSSYHAAARGRRPCKKGTPADLFLNHTDRRNRSSDGERSGHQQDLGEADVAERATNAADRAPWLQ